MLHLVLKNPKNRDGKRSGMGMEDRMGTRIPIPVLFGYDEEMNEKGKPIQL